MSAYTKPIIRFGLITPMLFNCVLLGGVVAGIDKLNSMRALKEERYKEHAARLVAMKALEEKIAPQRKSFEENKQLLSADPSQLFTRIIDTQLPKYKSIELERSSLVFPLDRGRIGRQVHCDAARVKSSFQGGIGPMQEVLIQVEELMPQAVLEDLKITRKSDSLLNRPDYLVLEMTHICWKAGEVKS